MLFDQAIDNFFAGNIEEAATSFDTLLARTPSVTPQLWQRGIVLNYGQRFDDCRDQFESHRTVNPNDVENAAWHFLYVASSESPECARAALLPVGSDPRLPMQEVYGLFSDSQAADDVMAGANGRAGAEFYAHLYVGLYAEAHGDREEAFAHISEAAVDRYHGSAVTCTRLPASICRSTTQVARPFEIERPLPFEHGQEHLGFTEIPQDGGRAVGAKRRFVERAGRDGDRLSAGGSRTANVEWRIADNDYIGRRGDDDSHRARAFDRDRN